MSEALQGGDIKERKRPPRSARRVAFLFYFGDKSANAALPFDIVTDVERPWMPFGCFPLRGAAGRFRTWQAAT